MTACAAFSRKGVMTAKAHSIEWPATAMDCGSCAGKVRRAVERLPDVSQGVVLCRQEQHEPGIFAGVGQSVELENLIGGRALSEAIQAQLDHVRDEHPFHAPRVHGVFHAC